MRRRPTSLLDTSIAYDRWGRRGPRLLLVHAIGMDRHSWESIAPQLAQDFQVAALDLPGHGESDKPAGVDYGIWALAARVHRFLDELEWPDALVVGNSLGGGVSLAMTLQQPDRVRGLALIDSVAFRSGLPLVGRLAFVPVLPLTTALAPRLAVRLGLETARRRWGSVTAGRCDSARCYLRSREGRGAFFRALRQLYGPDLDEMSEHYGEIHCPTLVLHGERDPLIRLEHAARLATAIPTARLETLPGVGHFPQEEAPEETLQHLRRFLTRFKEPVPAHAL